MLPDEKKTVTELERVIRQFVERALKDVREDAETFGQASQRPESASGDP
jgi:hypothetical protein